VAAIDQINFFAWEYFVLHPRFLDLFHFKYYKNINIATRNKLELFLKGSFFENEC